MRDRFKKSLFLKQFTVYILVLLFSFVLLGIVFTNAFKAYYKRERQQLLIQQAERISEQYAISIYTGLADTSKINRELMFLSDNLGASTMLVARNGRVLFISSDIDRNWIGAYLNEESLNRAINGEIVVTEKQTGSIFSDSALTIIYPIKADETVFAALIMNVSVPGMREQIIGVYLTIFAVLTACGIISFIVLYFSVRRITKPLIEINKAAKIIAGGDFEKRIETGLADEVGQLAESFNEMAESLNELEQSKRDFITNISHDIRSPLTSIRGFVGAMQDGTAPPESFNRYLNIVGDEAERIIKLADEIIDLNALEGGVAKLSRRDFDINQLIRDCAEKAENGARLKELGFELVFSEDAAFVNADAGKIRRVLENLIDNAIKFTESGKITVETETVQGKVRVSVKDTGIGLDTEEAKRVFERFYKADESRGQKGNGLGLSIVKELIKAHGEAINMQSKKGMGTVFSFHLPVSQGNKGSEPD